MNNELDILAIFAHPDDVELAVGGTLLKMKSLGYKFPANNRANFFARSELPFPNLIQQIS